MLDIKINKADRGDVVWLSTAETAQLIRQELKTAFPGIKFSVKSKEYSGGSSVTVRYTNGPKDKEVEAVVDRVVAMKEYQGRTIRTGAGYTFVNRDHTLDIFKAIILAVRDRYGLPDPIFAESATDHPYVVNEWFPERDLNYHREFYHEFGLWDEKDGLITCVEDLPSVKKAKADEAEWEAGQAQRDAERAEYLAAEAQLQAEEEAAKAEAEKVIAVAVAAAQAEGWAGKVPAVGFVLDWSESNRADCWRVFPTWQAIHQHIRHIAEAAPSDGAYDKTGFIVYWADGNTYGGRLDIQHPSRPADSNDNDLAGHIYDFVHFHAGLHTAETLPSHLDMAQYYSFLRMMGDDHQRDMLELLEKYDIPQADHLGQPVPAAVTAITREALHEALDLLEGTIEELEANPQALPQVQAQAEMVEALGQAARVAQPKPSQTGGRFAGIPDFNWL